MKKRVILCGWLLAACSLQAKITLPAHFTDKMILQQQTEVPFYGQAAPSRPVEIHVGWSRETYRTESDADGNWQIRLKTPKAGGPYDIAVSDGDERRLRDVLVGEVWFCSGQSNMEMPLAGWGKVLNYQEEIAAANHPAIRLFQVKKRTSLTPEERLDAAQPGWETCSPATVSGFSAVAYFFARRLNRELGVPVGVIDCTWGGTPAEAWTSYDALEHVPEYRQQIGRLRSLGFDPQLIQEHYENERRAWQATFEKAGREPDGSVPVYAAGAPGNGWKSMQLPGLWEKRGLPGFDGVVWFCKQVDIPDRWEGKALSLSLGKIDDEDTVYLNGREIGSGAGHATPRRYTIPAGCIKGGRNVLTVRVADYGGEGGIYGNDDELYLSDQAGNRISLAGDWMYRIGCSLRELPPVPAAPVGNAHYPASLYNAMVHPLVRFPVKGVLWYQGETNTSRAAGYADLFQALIADWRDRRQAPDLPFYFVQLAAYMERKDVQPHSEWAALREAQSRTLALLHTGMAVAIDIGDANDIHPKNKQEVARRLALLALNRTYGRSMPDQAPVYRNYTVERNRIRLRFDAVGKGFRTSDPLTGFTIAGTDHVFYPAKARIENNEIVVEAPQVAHPVAVRYGWADNPACNVTGKNGLPVAPFRTDSW